MAKTTVYIHGGDVDCSELVRMCYRAVEVLPYGSYMWTGNEVSLLKSHGFKERSLSSPQMGDVLWRSGHTEIYLGDGMEGGARVSETGGINGKKGDQTGKEITRSTYDRGHWSKLLRYEGGKTIGGIPCAIAAALVADHIIDHSAHGYSQPNRAGDGTLEAVTIEWGEKAASQTVKAGTYECVVDRLNVRDKPTTAGSAVKAQYVKGETVVLTSYAKVADGCVWGRYKGATSGQWRYVAVRKTNGTVYLRKV